MSINYGKDPNFFKQITVNELAFPSTPQVVINVSGVNHLSIVNLGTTAGQTVEYSFNGNVLHGNCIPGTPRAGIVFDDRRVSYIWFRTTADASDVTIEAW